MCSISDRPLPQVRPYDAHIYTNDGSSFSAVSVAKVLNVQRPKWNRSWLRRRPNRLASEGDGPPTRSKVIVSE